MFESAFSDVTAHTNKRYATILNVTSFRVIYFRNDHIRTAY